MAHLIVTWLVAIGSNLSALWILIANGWMQNPVGAAFNPQTMRMEVTDFAAVLINPVAQAKFVHTVSAGYTVAAMFVLGVSAWYVLKGRHLELAKRSMTVAASFGLAGLAVGGRAGRRERLPVATEHQKMKIAAIEAMWKTEPAPAAFTAFGFPDQRTRETHFAVQIPRLLGLIATRSLDQRRAGHRGPGCARRGPHPRRHQGLRRAADDPPGRERCRGAAAGAAPTSRPTADFLGYALLLKRYVDDPRQATAEQIAQAALDTGAAGVAAVLDASASWSAWACSSSC